VTPITASSKVKPAANALMPSSSSSTYTVGTEVPAASAISSTTLSSRRPAGSVVLGSSRFPPRSCATDGPPPESAAIL
jgi:hypothetical protein